MNPGKRNHTKLRYFWLAMVIVATALATAGLRRTAFFQNRVELPLYDRLVLTLTPWAAGHPDIVLATIRDPENWPWSDERLARFLETTLTANPTCIVVDLIRDAHVPADPESKGARLLRELVRRDGRIVWARGVPGAPGDFPPPAATSDLTDEWRRLHVGLAGFPLDGDGMIRRGLLAVHDGAWFSLPYHAAFRHRIAAGADADAVLDRMEMLARVGSNSGGYVAGVGGGSQFLLKSALGLDTLFPCHPAEAVDSWGEEQLREAFGGRIILLGTHDASLAQDEKQVPGNPDLRGLKLVATATAQLLRELEGVEEPVGWLSDAAEDFSLFLAALLAALLAWKLPLPVSLRAATAIPVSALVVMAVAAWLLKQGIWIPAGAPMAAVVLSAAGSQALMFACERSRGNSLYSLLEKNVGPQVAARLWQHNETLLAGNPTPPEHFHGTAFFADLKGYTAATERFRNSGDRAGFLRWLNAYLDACVPAVTGCGGFIQQFAGDGIFVIFGFPDSDDHPPRALECAAEIARRVIELNAAGPATDPPYHARIGIYTGEILCATVGNRDQMQFSFLGSTINKAARLESLHKDDHDTGREAVRVLFSDSTHAEAGDGFSCEKFHPDPLMIDPNLPPEIVWKLK